MPDPDLGSLSESGTCSFTPTGHRFDIKAEVVATPSIRFPTLTPSRITGAPLLCKVSWNSTFRSTLLGVWAAQGRSCPNAPTSPSLNNSPNSLQPVCPHSLSFSLKLTIISHSHKAFRQGKCQRPSEEKRREGARWSRPRDGSRQAQRCNPPFRFQLFKKFCARASSRRAIKATPGHRTRSYSSLLLR